MSLPSSDFQQLATQFPACSQVPEFGLCKLELGEADAKEVYSWLEVLKSGLPKEHSVESSETGKSNLQGTGVNWQRLNLENVFPFYMESLAVVAALPAGKEETMPVRQGFPGQWFVAAEVFDTASASYFGNHVAAWQDWVRQKATDVQNRGGLSCNVLVVPAEELRSGAVDVRPLVLHALSEDGTGVDRGDAAAQAAIANAFWQTFWATGATRAERGNVFPVAFFPVDRASRFEFAEPFHERYVSLRRRLFGRSAIVGFALEKLTAAKALLFDAEKLQFGVADDFNPANHETTGMDVLLALEELNRTGWVDAYTGENATAFQSWKAAEETGKQGEPWPYEQPERNGKIKAAGHNVADPLMKVRMAAGADGIYRIHRVVPYAGCAYLYQVMQQLDELRRRGKVQDLDGELIGATNSTFFLNFPEEYSALHSAMNEPVSLLVECGQTRQIKTLKRATFVLTEDGEAIITTRAGNRLKSDALVFEGESSSATYVEKANASFRENKFGPLFFGAAVVGNAIVETFEEIATEVPPAGWLIGDSEAFGGRIDPETAAEAQVRKPGELKDVAIRHAFAIGPLLLKDGEVVPLSESREDFVSVKLNSAMSFEETSELARTQLPKALLDCEARGVPPTRFPYDWDRTRAPRSAIGVRNDGSVVVAVVDGRADLPHSVGATLEELAVIMKGLGCRDAMNMDGGGSSVMFVNDPAAEGAKLRSDLRDGIVSLPSDMGGVERLLPVPLVITKRR